MTNAATLRERAERCRAFAREYDPSVGRPLLDKARALEFQAAMLERAGRERRMPPRTEREAFLAPKRPIFGKLRRS